MSGGRGGTQCTRPPSSHPSPCCADGYGQLVVHMFAQEISMHLWNAYPHGHEPSSGTSGEGDQILPCVASVSCSQGGQGWTNLLVREQGHSGPSEASSSWVLALELAAPQDPGDEHAGSDVVSIATGNSSDAQLGEWTRRLKSASPYRDAHRQLPWRTSLALLGPTCSLIPAPWEENTWPQTSTDCHCQERAKILFIFILFSGLFDFWLC